MVHFAWTFLIVTSLIASLHSLRAKVSWYNWDWFLKVYIHPSCTRDPHLQKGPLLLVPSLLCGRSNSQKDQETFNLRDWTEPVGDDRCPGFHLLDFIFHLNSSLSSYVPLSFRSVYSGLHLENFPWKAKFLTQYLCSHANNYAVTGSCSPESFPKSDCTHIIVLLICLWFPLKLPTISWSLRKTEWKEQLPWRFPCELSYISHPFQPPAGSCSNWEDLPFVAKVHLKSWAHWWHIFWALALFTYLPTSLYFPP